MSDYIKGQEELIKYIKQQLLLMADNSTDETIMLDVVNFLQNLKPKHLLYEEKILKAAQLVIEKVREENDKEDE